MSCNDDLAQKIEQLRVCLDRGLFTPTEFENAKSEAIRLFLSAPTPMATPEGSLRMNPLYAETDDPEPTNTDDAEQEDTESVICAIGNSPALQELLNSEHDSRRDDWIFLRNTQFTRTEISDLTATEFRYFILGSKRSSDYMASLFSTESFPVPEALVPDVLRWIRFSNHYELLPKIVREKDSRIALHLLKHHPELFRLDTLPADFVQADEFVEIFVELALMNLSRVSQSWARQTWSVFFDMLMGRRSEWEDFGVDEMLLASPNLDGHQMAQLVTSKIVATPTLMALLLRNLERRALSFRRSTVRVVVVALTKAAVEHSPDMKSSLLQMLKTSPLLAEAGARSTSSGGGQRYTEEDAANLRALQEVLENAGGDGSDFGRQARLALVQNKHLPPSSVVGLVAGQPDSRSESLFVIAAHNPSLWIASSTAIASNFLNFRHAEVASVDAVLTAFLSYQHHEKPLSSEQQRQVLTFINANSSNILAGSIVNCSLALAAVPHLEASVVTRLAGPKSDIFTKAVLARRPDLPLSVRDTFLQCSDEEIQIAALSHEPRANVQRRALRQLMQQPSASEPACVRDRKLETLASNPRLPAELQRELAESFADDSSSSSSSSSPSWRVHRALAGRADLAAELVPMLLRTKDLDVYTNVARNEHLPLDAPTIKSMCSIAGPAVEREEQALWVPSLKLMHEPSSLSTSSDEEREQRLLGLLHSYQSQLRMQVLECHSNSVAEDDVCEWVDDPDISVLLAIVTQMPRLSLRLVRDVATSEANAALRGDKLSHLAARILRDWAQAAARTQAPLPSMEAVTAETLEALSIVISQRDRTVARRLLTVFTLAASTTTASSAQTQAAALVHNERLPAIPGFDPMTFAIYDGVLTAGVLRMIMTKHLMHEDIMAEVGKVLGSLAQQMKEERDETETGEIAADPSPDLLSSRNGRVAAVEPRASKPVHAPLKTREVLLQGWADLRPSIFASFRPFNRRYFILTSDRRLLTVTGGPNEPVDATRNVDSTLRSKGHSFTTTWLDGATVKTDASESPAEVLEVDATERKLHIRFSTGAERNRWARTIRALIAGRIDEAVNAASSRSTASSLSSSSSSSSSSSPSAGSTSSEEFIAAAPPRRSLTVAEREASEALILEFCGNSDVPFELVEPFVETASESMLQVIFGRLDVPTANIWDLFIRETTVSGYDSDRLGMLAARASLPEDMRWTLALLQSRLGVCNLDEVRLQIEQRDQIAAGNSPRFANKLLSTLLEQESALNCSILHYYLQYEPAESLALLQSGLLLPSAVKYLRSVSSTAASAEKTQSSLHMSSLRGRFEDFEASARALTGKIDLSFESLPLHRISSACMNQVIRAAVHGVSLRGLPSLIEETLGLPREECDEIRVLLEMMEVLFPRRCQEEQDNGDGEDEDGGDRHLEKGDTSYGIGIGDDSDDDGDAAADDPGAILVCSVNEVRNRLQDFLLSFEWHQWLAEFLDRGWINFDEASHKLKLKAELPFDAELDEQLSEKLQGHLKNVVGSRALERRFNLDLLKRVVAARELTIDELVAILQDLGLSGDGAPPTVLTGLAEAGYGEELVAGGCDRFLDRLMTVARDLHRPGVEENASEGKWASVQRLVNLVNPHVETSAATSGETDEACHARLMKLPYLAVSAFAAFFPLRAAEIFSSRALFLISIWGTDSSAAAAPSLSPSSLSLGYLDAQLSEILDFVEEGGRTLLKGIAVHPDILVSATGSDLTYDHYIDRRRQPHKCNMRIVAVKAWEALHDAATEVSSGLNDWLTNRDIKFKASLDVDDASEVSRLRFNSAALSLSDLKAAGVFSKDTFRAVGEHVFEPFPATSEAMETYSVRAFGRAVRPYRSLLKVDQVFYMHAGSMRNARDAQAIVQLDEYCRDDQLDFPSSRMLPLFEQAELLLTLQRDVRALHNVSVRILKAQLSKFRLSSSLSSPAPVDDLEAALGLETGGIGSGAGRPPLLLRDLSVAKELLQGMIQDVATRGTELGRSLLDKAELHVLRRPDHEHLRDCMMHDTVRMEGHSSMLYPLVLDEATLSPVVDPEDPSCFLRDRSRPKQLLPVEFPIKRVVQRPTMVVEPGGGRRLHQSALEETLVVNDLHVLESNIRSRLEGRIAAVLGTTFSTINRTYLEDEIRAIRRVVDEGFNVPLPSLHEVRVVPHGSKFHDQMERLSQLPSTLSSHAPDQIATFSFSRRASLPAELMVLARLLVAARHAQSEHGAASSSTPASNGAESNFVEPAMVRSKWFQLVLAVAIMRSDANYHIILDRLQPASSLQRQLGDIFTRMLNVEAVKSGGVVMAAFRLNNRGDVIFVSSHYDPSARKWNRWLHYNCNACASLDFGEVESQNAPHDYGDGRCLEAIHCTLFDTTLLLSFSSQCVQRIRMTTHDQVTTSIARGELNDETGVGDHRTMTNFSVGRVNWYGNMNHFCKEAALLNASPIIPIAFDNNGGIQLLATDESIFRDLKELSETWMKQ